MRHSYRSPLLRWSRNLRWPRARSKSRRQAVSWRIRSSLRSHRNQSRESWLRNLSLCGGELTTYQNPFANMSKAPPIDTSLRPGPVSRWQRPAIPGNDLSAIKSAVLSQAQTAAAAPKHNPWDQLPPAEALRQHAATQNAPTDPTFYDRLTNSDQIIRFTPAPLTQPGLVTAEAKQNASVAKAGPAPFKEPPNAAAIPAQLAEATPIAPVVAKSDKMTKAFAVDSTEPLVVPAASKDELPTMISDCPDTSEDWLAQAQEVATGAESAEELSAVIEVCDRGIHEKPSAKMLLSLRKLSAWAHNRRGEMHADAQRPDEAIQDFQTAISMDPKCSLAIHNRAVTLAQRNQFAAALRDFNRVIELNPGLAVAYRNRAELLAALGRMEEAVADYTQAIESLPDDATLLQARAHAYQRLGDFAHAGSDINLAIQLAPEDPDAVTQRGNLSAEQGKFAQAQEDFRGAIAMDANWAEAYRSLAWLQATCPDPEIRNAQQALATAEQAAQLSSPEDYLVLDTLAAAHASGGKFEQAVEFEEKALAAAPRDLSTPLEQRLAMYRNGKSYVSAPAQSAVRKASHESAMPPSSRPSPSPRQAPR